MDYRRKNLFSMVIVVITLLLVGIAPQVIYAQTGPQKIPIVGRVFTLRVAPDGNTAAAFRSSALYEDVPDPIHLPIEVIDLAAGKVVGQLTDFTDYASDVAFSSDSKQMASYHQNGEIRLWDLATLKLTKTISAFVGRARLFFTPDNHTLVIGLNAITPNAVLFLDVETGSFTKRVSFDFKSFKDFREAMSKGFPDMLDYQFAALALSPDGTTVAAATASDRIYLWDAATNQPTLIQDRSEKPRTFSFNNLIFIMDGSQLVYYDFDAKRTIFWNVKANKQLTYKFEGGSIFAVSDDALMMAWIEGSDLKTWRWGDPATKTHTFALPEGYKAIIRQTSIFISADKNQVMVGGLGAPSDEENYIFVYPIKD